MTESEPAKLRSRWVDARLFGIVVFVLALAVRLFGIGWGLPDERHHWSRHPDEPVVWLYSQNIKPAELKFTPGFYNYGTLYLTMLRVSTDVVNGYGGGPQKQDGSDQWEAIGRYHLAGRVMSALAGAGMCWVTLLLLWRRTHWVGAVFGALAVAFAPGLVVHSKFQTVDVVATFFLTLGLYYALRLVPPPNEVEVEPRTDAKNAVAKLSPETWSALVSGLFFGLSAGTKYTGLLGLIPLVVVCIATKKWKEMAFGLVAFIVMFLVTTPGVLLDSEKFWKDFGYEMAHTSQGHGLVFAGTSPGFIYHVVNLAIGFGTILVLLGALGMVRAVSKKHLWAIALVAFALAYYLLIGRAEVKFLRYTFPLIPVLAVFGGWIIGQAHTHPNPRMRALGVLGILGLGGVFGGGAGFSLRTSYLMQALPDPRSAAMTALGAKGTEPAKIGLVSDPWFYSPDFYPEAGAPRWVPFEARQAEMAKFAQTRPGSELLRYVPDNPNERIDWDVRLLDQKPDLVVFSSFETEGIDRLYRRGNVPDEFKPQVANYKVFIERMMKEYEPAYGSEENPYLAVHDFMYIRPDIYIWKRKNDSVKPSSGSSTTSSTSAEPAATR